jgi:hypothetical protein
MPERRLQAYLNLGTSPDDPARVFTLGVGGYGQDQQLLVLREYYEDHRADVVILWITPANDVWNNVFPTNQPRYGVPKPTFWLAEDELRGPSEPLGAIVNASPIRIISLIRGVVVPRQRERRWARLLPAPYASRPAAQVSATLPRIDLRGTSHEQLDIEKGGLGIWLTPPSERASYGIALTRRLMHEMRQLVESHGGTFLVLRTTAPGLPPFPDEAECVLNGRAYRTTRRQYGATVEALLQGFAVAEVPVTVDSWRVSEEDPHLNEAAVDQVMRDLASVIPIPRNRRPWDGSPAP